MTRHRAVQFLAGLLLASALPPIAAGEGAPREWSWREPAHAEALWRAAARLGLAAPGETHAAATDEAAWRAFNQARAAAHGRGERIFGPREFSHADYRSYVASQKAAAVRQALATSRPGEFEDEALRARYDRERARFARHDTLELAIIEAGAPPLDEAALRAAFTAARETWSRQSAPPAGAWKFEREIADDYAQRRAERHRAALHATITPEIQPGEFSPVVVADGAIMLARLVARTSGGFVSFEEARPQLRARMLDEAFRALLDEALAEAIAPARTPP